eukprot:365452-Chlamydomonas_euryale.AAC.4
MGCAAAKMTGKSAWEGPRDDNRSKPGKWVTSKGWKGGLGGWQRRGKKGEGVRRKGEKKEKNRGRRGRGGRGRARRRRKTGEEAGGGEEGRRERGGGKEHSVGDERKSIEQSMSVER